MLSRSHLIPCLFACGVAFWLGRRTSQKATGIEPRLTLSYKELIEQMRAAEKQYKALASSC